MSSAYNGLKSAIDGRVNISTAQKIGSERTNGGHGCNCAAGSGHLQWDIYGRPATQNTLNVSDANCSKYTEFDHNRRIQVESVERPYIPICRAGRPGDGMGVGRDVNPRDVYGTDCGRGHFHRDYPNSNRPPTRRPPPSVSHHKPYYYGRNDMSMDATQRVLKL